jgi:putative ABC transport system permease protein
MVVAKMAFRNIFRQKRRTLFTGLSVGGGFALAAIFIGWADGSYDSIINQFTRTRLGQIQIHAAGYLDKPTLYKTIPDPARIEPLLDRTRGVESWAPRVYAAGLASLGDKTAGVQIIGVDPEREERTTRIARMIVRGSPLTGPEARQALVGRGLADILGARPGDDIVLLSQGADGSIAEDQFALAGVVSTGDDVTDRTAFYLPLHTAQDYLVLDDRVHEIAVVIAKLGQARAISAELGAAIGDRTVAVEPWQVFAKSFYQAMKADKAGMWVMLLVIVIIVAVGVLNTVLMAVLERRREYGLLKALGTKPGRIVRLVLLEVLFLSILAGLAGAAVGLGANAVLSRHGIKFGSGLTYGGMVFDTMTSEINLRSFIIPAITVVLCAVVVSLVPAIKAARTEPARTMRMH